MKKIFALFLSFLIFNSNICFGVEIFCDKLADQLNKNLKIEKQQMPHFEDNLAKKLNQDLKITIQKETIIEDELVKNTLNKNLTITKKQIPKYSDFIFDKNTPKTITIAITPNQYYTTRKNIDVGDFINFKLNQDVKINNKIYKKGTLVKARVEMLSKNASYGTPADLTISNFTLKNIELEGEIKKTGANRALWIHPTSIVMSMFFGFGLLLLPIRGGHAKLKPNEVYRINYMY